MPNRRGLLYVWATAIAAMFIAYVLFSYVVPFIAVIDYFANQIFYMLGIDQSPWKTDIYDYWGGILRQAFGWMSGILFFSLILYLYLTSARREPNEVGVY